MARAKGCAAIGISAWFLAALVACGTDGGSAAAAGNSERRTLRVARTTGGQSGMEGSCLPVPEPRPFSADDVRALIEGTEATTLAYRAESSPSSASPDVVGLPLTVKVELQGEPRIDPEVYERCNFRIEQDVAVTLSLDEPALDVVIESTASAFSSTFAVLQRELGSDVTAALGLPPRDVTTFSLAFDERGVEGSFELNDGCGRAVFPASARCPDWSSIEVDLDRQRPELRARLLSAIEELRDVPLEWSDGTQTTLDVTLVEPPEWACSGAWVETFCPEALKIPLSIRAVTADGRLDAELPAELSADVATEASAAEGICGLPHAAGELEGILISASFGVAAGGPNLDVIPLPEADTGISLQVRKVPESPEEATAEIWTYTLERRDPGLTPPIDAATDPADASCVVFTPIAEVESP